MLDSTILFNVEKNKYNIIKIIHLTDVSFNKVESFRIEVTNRKAPLSAIIENENSILIENSFICHFVDNQSMKLFLEDLFYLLETLNDIPTFLRQTESKLTISTEEILETFDERQEKHDKNIKIFFEKLKNKMEEDNGNTN